MTIYEKLVDIQGRLKAPKNQRNNFGNYNYRSCEDILEAVKPLLVEHKLALTISDFIENQGALFVSATAKLSDGSETIMVNAQAGIDINKKGMDIAQSFGSSSSYARKYALNGLFLIDDTKDSDATNTHGNTVDNSKPLLENNSKAFVKAAKFVKDGGKIEDIQKKYRVTKQVEKALLEIE